MFDDEEAPDKVARFLLLLEIASVDDTDKLSPLAIESVEAPMFDDDTSRLLAGSLPVLAVDGFGEPARGL